MPVIDIEYDNKVLKEKEILTISQAIQNIVSQATGIEDVFVYANTAKIKVKIAPLEIFVRMSAHKIKDRKKLVQEIKSRLRAWKKKVSFKHMINFTLIPMDWNIEIGI